MNILKTLHIESNSKNLPTLNIPESIKTTKVKYNGKELEIPKLLYTQVKKAVQELFGKEYSNSGFMDSVLEYRDNIMVYDITYTVPLVPDMIDKLTKYEKDNFLYEISLSDFSVVVGDILSKVNLPKNVSLVLTQISDPRYTQGRSNLSMSLHVEIVEEKEEHNDTK